MHRKDREITDIKIINEILQKNVICRVAYSENNKPYITPLNYGKVDDIIYIHTAKVGKKLDIIKENNNVCFEVTDYEKVEEFDIACKFTTKFRSVIGYGQMFFVNDKNEKIFGMQTIMKQQTGKDDWHFDSKVLDMTQLLKIKINSVTGKQLI